MPRRPVLILAPIVLLAALAGWLMLDRRDDRRDHRPPPPHHAAMPLPDAILDPELADTLGQPMFAVLPAHQAVREINRRFDGRLIGLALVSPSPPEAARGVQLVYAARLLSKHRDVVEIRLDARQGRLLSARGNDLAAARRRGKDD
ncbi:PepSY domain-containing protein [Paracoccus luteus]|uniref:PepSY domain-containing protein n=1 Tax=Paracoccus luteus TaxID=2508543 RepID=UPI00106FA11E|nr:hypothetical protein [Paracoccus luteus]